MKRPKPSQWNGVAAGSREQHDYYYSSGDLIMYGDVQYGLILSRGNLEYTYSVILWPTKEGDDAWKYRKYIGDGDMWTNITITEYNSKFLVSGGNCAR